MDNPLSQIANLVPLIEKIAADKATQIVQQILTAQQFTVPKVPDHHHNTTDSSTLNPIEAVDGFQALPAITGGVVSPTKLGNQSVVQGPINVAYGNLSVGNNSAIKGIFSTYPIPIIYGHGVGADSAFNGGTAPAGTVIFFDNGPTLSGLWVNIDGTNWKGSAGSTFNLTA